MEGFSLLDRSRKIPKKTAWNQDTVHIIALYNQTFIDESWRDINIYIIYIYI